LGSDRDANNGPISFGYMLFGFISKNNEWHVLIFVPFLLHTVSEIVNPEHIDWFINKIFEMKKERSIKPLGELFSTHSMEDKNIKHH
jgi:hypothetical protein